MANSKHETSVLLDGFRIVVDPGDAQAGTRSYGYFATEKDAIDYAMGHRDRLGLDRCVSWYVEHSDA
jgi:hypothetical protein